jgi:hypothetical protein
MISSYRLGDLVLLGLNNQELTNLIDDYPNSIGDEYVKNKYTVNNISKIINIVLNHIEKYKDILPKDIENSTVIHLRLGDVICGNEGHEQLKRPLSLSYLHLFLFKTPILYENS